MSSFPPLPPVRPGLFFTDNGRVLCGAHLGATARATGRDLSGQPIAPVTTADAEALAAACGTDTVCDTCGGKGGARV